MKSKYDLDCKTPIAVIKKCLKEARAEGKLYVVTRIVGFLQHRGCSDCDLTLREKKMLLSQLQLIRSGQKILAKWLPIGYQTARFIMLAKGLSGRNVRVTKRDVRRIKAAAHMYCKKGDWHSKRQLRSLKETAQSIGLNL